ncbi:MAG: tRNA pseudouridine(55) synthase TruB [Endomicrobia bacterium]|nr:tRNA pseudouridine(55) synthase TruB [Endomicrobiia bacterium]MCX7940767.1 tRNA pseudouridine(55) synthase TruB [Endomicrobiia bacterium]MDW8055595.1 tRNA pseudouridine(55) synthase TruB [Elusimicrobiota bacterium]
MLFTEGIYNIYKPPGITTYKIVAYVKRHLKEKFKVGHGGTLDPFAEGVVVIAVGRKYTRQLHNILNNSVKEYIAYISLDKTSDTHDITGEIKHLNDITPPEEKNVKKILSNFVGEIEQLPPVYSAIKFQGERLCDKIRLKKLTYDEAIRVLKPKRVRIYSLELLEYKFPKLVLRIVCSSGTYIRSLARDIGEKLNCGGVVEKLIRTKVGDYSIENSIRLPISF